MKKLMYMFLFLFVSTISLNSCRETKSTEDKMEEGVEEVGDEMEEGAEEVEDEIDDAVDDN
jgi:hypothetical protein